MLDAMPSDMHQALEQSLRQAMQEGIPQSVKALMPDQSQNTLQRLTGLREQLEKQEQTQQTPITVRHYHCDHLGTPLALTDQNQQIVWAARLDPWGNIEQEFNPHDIEQSIRLPGQHHDKDTGLYYNRHRYYDPRIGSYVNQDPIGLNGGVNLFAYVGGNPLLFVDPEGLRSARPAAPGGNAYNRRQWRRHGPGSFERPTGEGNQSAWESGAEMFTPNPDEGDYRLRCLRWECSENSCTPGKSPTDFLPAAYHQDDAPSGCKCTQTNLGPVFNPPQFDPNTDFPDIYDKYRRSGGQLGRMWRALR